MTHDSTVTLHNLTFSKLILFLSCLSLFFLCIACSLSLTFFSQISRLCFFLSFDFLKIDIFFCLLRQKCIFCMFSLLWVRNNSSFSKKAWFFSSFVQSIAFFSHLYHYLFLFPISSYLFGVLSTNTLFQKEKFVEIQVVSLPFDTLCFF